MLRRNAKISIGSDKSVHPPLPFPLLRTTYLASSCKISVQGPQLVRSVESAER